MSLATHLLLVPLLILLNAFFVAAEYALVAVRRPQIRAMVGTSHRRAALRIERLRQDMAATLGGIQVCITMSNLLLGWIGEPAMTSLVGSALRPFGLFIPVHLIEILSILIGFLVVTLVTVVASELLPKAITLQHTLAIARFVAGPLLIILQAIRPLVWAMDRLANLASRLLGLGPVRIEDAPVGVEELKAIARDAGERGSLGRHGQALIVNVLDLPARRAEDIMVPRTKVAYLDLQRTLDANRDIVDAHLFSRFPLCNGGMDRIIGIVHAKDFLTAFPEAAQSSVLQLLARPAFFAPSTISLEALLRLFLDKHAQMLVLVDEYGGVDGIATLTDLMNQLLREDHT